MRQTCSLLVLGIVSLAAPLPAASAAPPLELKSEDPVAVQTGFRMVRAATEIEGTAPSPPSTRNSLSRGFGAQHHFTFEDARTGRLPVGWHQGAVGEGVTDWTVLQTPNGRVLAQTRDDNPNAHFNVAWLETLTLKNVSLTVRFRAVSGKLDQGGGLIWRARNERDHYLVRANPLEDNVVLYKMENGQRTDLPLVEHGRTYGVKVSKLSMSWHTLGVEIVEDTFTVSLDGLQLFQVTDTTFAEAGHVGFWTKADAVTWFDDLHIVELN